MGKPTGSFSPKKQAILTMLLPKSMQNMDMGKYPSMKMMEVLHFWVNLRILVARFADFSGLAMMAGSLFEMAPLAN
ncbi:hypothetical protein [Oscillatoria acuminata]|nr:hypothetical protein [Oscillatoria acuminata]